MPKRKKRKSLGGGVRKIIKKTKKGKRWLNALPDGISEFEPKGGKTYIFDIMPYVVPNVKKHPDSENIPEDIWYRYPYKLHRNLGPDDEDIICPESNKKKCPSCNKGREIYNDEEGDDDLASTYMPSKRALYAIRMKSGPDKGDIKIFDISDWCFWNKVLEEIDDGGDPDYENFADMEGGYSLKVRFKEQKFGGNKFPKASRVDFVERDDIDEDELDEVPVLDKLITIPSSKEMKTIFDKIQSDDEDDSNDDDGDTDLEEMDKEELIEYADDMGIELTRKEKKLKEKKLRKVILEYIEEMNEDDQSSSPELDWDDIKDLDEDDLLEISEEHDLGYEEDDYDDEDELRELIAEDLEIEKPKKKNKGKRK